MRIRTATPADVPALLALDPAADATDLRRLRWAEQVCAGAHGLCLVAETGAPVSRPAGRTGVARGGLAGTVLLRPGQLLGRDEVAGLFVATGSRRGGVGTALATSATAAAVSDVVLAVTPRASLAARALLASTGWTVSGRLEGLGGDDAVVVLRTHAGPPPAPGRLYHLALRREWDRALRAGGYRTSTLALSLAEVGFVHCSYARQLPLVAAAMFSDVLEPVVLLTIDRSRLSGRVLVEAVRGTDEVFPHVYGPIALPAVLEVTPIRHDSGGGLVLPPLG